MCLIALAYETSERYDLVVAANRDERHARPSAAAGWWPDAPGILGGRDLVAGGTWLAADRTGRLAAVTNREAAGEPPAPRSRGRLATDFLQADRSAAAFSDGLAAEPDAYGPFNLVLYDGAALHFVSNRGAGRPLPPGVHGIGNTAIDSDWPKLETARRGMRAALELADPTAALFAALADRGADDAAGAGGHAARRSAVFIEHPEFGTRSSTVIVFERGGRVTFVERRFDAAGASTGESRFEFTRARFG